MTPAWANLPNAKHIDRVLDSVKIIAPAWAGGWYSVSPDASVLGFIGAACSAAESSLRNAGRQELLTPVWDACNSAITGTSTVITGKSAVYSAWAASVALIAWDDCAYMLDSDPGELAILAKFGDERAILLLPACIALAEEKESV